MNKTVWIAALLVSTTAFAANKAGELDVTHNPDGKMAHELLIEMGPHLYPCLMKQSGSGMSTEKAESYCFCKLRSFISPRVHKLEEIWSKHPDWKTKTLVYGKPEDRHSFSIRDVDDLRTGLENAANECK